MPTTRKKVIKTVYKDDGSEAEEGDFSDSGSDAKFSDAEESTSEEESFLSEKSSGDEFHRTRSSKKSSRMPRKTSIKKSNPNQIKKSMVYEIKNSKQKIPVDTKPENIDVAPALFSVKDLTEADKLLPSILNLSESDSSDDETPKPSTKKIIGSTAPLDTLKDPGSDNEDNTEYKDVWSNNIQESSEEIAKKTFMKLAEHKTKIEEAKASLQNYTLKMDLEKESNIQDLLALGEEVMPESKVLPIKKKAKKKKDDSDSEMEDWEEVHESKETIPKQGIQLFVEFPDACRKPKKVDVEMMMKRKINRVKKEYQVYMHKVHVLCWLGHGNYVSRILNDQEIMAAALSLVPSKECYPGERVDMKYVEQVTIWFKDKLTLKQDRHEDKFRPKAPPLRNILLEQIKSKIVTSRKYLVFIFISMLRALGLQCRVMFNFVTLPIKPPHSELCSLSTKAKSEKSAEEKSKPENNKKKCPKKLKASSAKTKKPKLHQVDGNYDSDTETSGSDFDNILQLDGNNDVPATKRTRSTTKRNNATANNNENIEDVSPPKLSRKNTGRKSPKQSEKEAEQEGLRRTQRNKNTDTVNSQSDVSNTNQNNNTKDIKPIEIKTRISPASRSPKPMEKKLNQRSKRTQINKNNATSETETKHSKEKASDIGKNGNSDEDVSPPKVLRKAPKRRSPKPTQKQNKKEEFKKSQITNMEDTNKPNIKIDFNGDMTNKIRVTRRLKSPKPEEKENNKDGPQRTQRNKNNESNKQEEPRLDTSSISYSTQPHKSTPIDVRSAKDKDNIAIEKITKKLSTNKLPVTNNKDTIVANQETKLVPTKITITSEDAVPSKYFEHMDKSNKSTGPSKIRLSRNRSETTNPTSNVLEKITTQTESKPKARTKSAPGNTEEKSKYFNETTPKRNTRKLKDSEDKQRVSHRDLAKSIPKSDNDITGDLVDIITKRIKYAKEESKKRIVKGKVKQESDEDSDYMPVEDPIRRQSGSDDDFKPPKISPKPSTSRKIDRRVLSSEDETPKNKIDVWCEIFVEELEQWVSVDVIKGKMHDVNTFYTNATHPVNYIVGWDNNNYLKDVTRKYVPHWNTVTRKQRAEPAWWDTAVQPWRGPRTAKDKEEDEYLDRMQLEAPLPKSVAEYKNHPLYALQRHLLKFEAIYPPDAAVLGFVRNETVYARECIYVCRSRDTWLKEAKVVKLGEKPYKVVKARPKWDKLSNKMITDKPLEVFGPWQVQDYEPPVAENGIVPRNAYGNVELFKECMLPKGTVHLKLPSLNRVARKLNIDCAPAMTGFEFNGGWSHPVYDGFVVCEEFEEIITEAWVKDQEEQERREVEKMEARVYGNWKRLIKGLLIRERLKNKYGFQEPAPTQAKGKAKGPKLVVKKKP